jgi:type I restriction-modification system DNA methylase subunit
MKDKMEIANLIERFEQNKDAYKSSQYNETQLRREFLDPFLEALGWDVENKSGYAEVYKDVVHEDAIKIGGVTKAPDYSFRIGGTRKFFVEAKKPAIHIKEDIDSAFQLRRYAWSAKLPLSILTNFEEFAIYDCRIKPDKTDKAATGRILYLTYKEYTQRWEEIASIFSREAVLKGAFDKFAEQSKLKKGTAEVDAVFLKEIDAWRDMLARNLALRNPELTQRELNFAVQTTIDRIIFLRICEDRGIEDYGRLLALLNGINVYERLCQLFRQADERYNSGLFHFREEKSRPEPPDGLTLNLTIDDRVIKEIIKNLYYPDSPYEFSVISADILGQVYEQFLGKVIQLTTGHRAVIDYKPEVKKAGGIYYTPRYIVDYIVKNTVGKLLEGKTPKQVANLKILDPACGSGSFLIGAYQYLLDWHRDWYVAHTPERWVKGRSPALYQASGGDWRLTTTERKRILLNNIYGVDIDMQAVEVTKLSLLLKVLEGETEQSISQQLILFHERALPDLGSNIKCGNSLIGPDFYEGKQMGLFEDEERYRINVFDWKKEFPEIMKSGGFDAVIENPPYGALLSKEAASYLLKRYHLQQYQIDTYFLFLEKSLGLMKTAGFLGMIIPNTWLLNLLTGKIRQYLFENTKIKNIVHYHKPVFHGATVDTEIVIFEKQKPKKDSQAGIIIVGKDGTTTEHYISQQRLIERKGKPINIFEKPELIGIADKIKKNQVLENFCIITQGTKPFQVGKGKPPQTKKTLQEKPFVAMQPLNPSFRPLLRGSLIQKYVTLWRSDYWISFGDWLAEPRYSANYDAPEKIVVRQTGDSIVATLDRKQFIVRDNLYTMVQREHNETNLCYFLGILNSHLINWFYQTILNPEKGEALAQVKRGHLAQLPIAMVNFLNPNEKQRHDQIVALVEQMLVLNKQLAEAKTPHDKTTIQRQIDATDHQIDQLVYELYGLTEEEIAIVERP